MSRVSAYVALTKPRIIELLLVTTLPTMVVAQRGLPPIWLMAVTMVGGSLAAGGANAINMVVDRDIDAQMPRTKNRPLVTGAVTPTAALIFAIVLEIASFAVLWSAVNLLSAVLAVSATAFYVFIYTMWLKRTSTQNIVIGGAAGAVPVLVGLGRCAKQLGWAPFLLFAVIFAWTPPHFWALAIKYREEYASVDVPMMPSVASHKSVSMQITLYTVALWAISLVFAPIAHMGPLYIVSATVAWRGVSLVLRRSAARRFYGARHAAVSLFDYVRHVAVRGHGRRPARPGTLRRLWHASRCL